MEKITIKNILWVIFGFASGYFGGQIIGGLLGSIIWAGVGLVVGGFPYNAPSTIAVNTMLSAVFGILLAYLLWSFDKRLLEGKTSFWVWGAAGAVAGLVVMFTYGVYIISHPERFGVVNGLNPVENILNINRGIRHSKPPFYLSPIRYGGATGQLIGEYFGGFAGLFISIRQTIGKKRKPEDGQQFEEYSKFFKERLKK